MLAGAALLSLQCGSDSPSQPQAQKPDITQFSASPADLVPGDSTLFTYAAVRADSLVLTPPGQRLASATSGSLYVKPVLPTRYTLRAYNASGQDSASVQVTMSTLTPVLTLALSEDTIVTGDSTTLTYTATHTDSVILQSVGKLTPAAGGARVLKPTANTTYVAVAYGLYGRDTAQVSVRVEVPYQIQAPNGGFYKGTMGSSVLNPELRFRVVDFSAATLYKPWIHFSATNGDGVLSADSLQPSSTGFADLNYDFGGKLGRATITATVPGYDTMSVEVRADILTPGASGQGQYVLFSDKYGTVKILNGPPASVDVDPQYCILYANYETAKGVVVVLEDNPCDATANDNEPVQGVIVNTVYAGKTEKGIGIGSTYAQITSAYGQPDSVYIDPNPPPALTLEYWALGMIIYCGTTDSTAFEIHLTKLVGNTPAASLT
ncbi:hypothetical protein C3F09_01700, partial [candidate division GN15 bacterium]